MVALIERNPDLSRWSTEIAARQAALDLADSGYFVYLVESSPAIGGILSQLDYQFPNNHCGMCKMLPVVGREYASQYCMRKSLFHDNIKILPFTDGGEMPHAFATALVFQMDVSVAE